MLLAECFPLLVTLMRLLMVVAEIHRWGKIKLFLGAIYIRVVLMRPQPETERVMPFRLHLAPPRALHKIRVLMFVGIMRICKISDQHIFMKVVTLTNHSIQFVLDNYRRSYFRRPRSAPTYERYAKKRKEYSVILWQLKHVFKLDSAPHVELTDTLCPKVGSEGVVGLL